MHLMQYLESYLYSILSRCRCFAMFTKEWRKDQVSILHAVLAIPLIFFFTDQTNWRMYQWVQLFSNFGAHTQELTCVSDIFAHLACKDRKFFSVIMIVGCYYCGSGLRCKGISRPQHKVKNCGSVRYPSVSSLLYLISNRLEHLYDRHLEHKVLASGWLVRPFLAAGFLGLRAARCVCIKAASKPHRPRAVAQCGSCSLAFTVHSVVGLRFMGNWECLRAAIADLRAKLRLSQRWDGNPSYPRNPTMSNFIFPRLPAST